MSPGFSRGGEDNAMTKILVVDDDQSCRKLMSKVLSIYGYSTVPASNGLEALDALRREPIDLILLDLMMPEMDGLTFVHEMREQPQWADVPVLVLSGVADLEFATTAAESGVQDYLVKSRYSVDELLLKVRQHLSWRGGHHQEQHNN
jgi:CheY-like chemotaxis protein